MAEDWSTALPKRCSLVILANMKNLALQKLFQQTHIPYWLILVLVAIFILRIPSFFEPVWYGDEAIYLTLGEGIKQGLLLYRDIHDNKPPLIYIFAAIAGNVFWLRVILAFWILGTAILFWQLARSIYPANKHFAKVATIIFAILVTIPILEGNIANAEVFMIGPVICAFLLLTKLGLQNHLVFIAGALIGFSALFKIPAVFDSGAIITLWLTTMLFARKKDWQGFGHRTAILILGIALPISLTFMFFWINGATPDYFKAAFLQNFGYLSSWRQTSGDLITQNMPIVARGITLLLVVSVLIFLLVKKHITWQFLLMGSWFAFSLFASLLSERPYPHYLIQVLPSLSLLLALATTNTREQFFTYPLFLIFTSALIVFKFNYYPVFPYYENFLAWVSGGKTQEEYFDNFDHRTSRNYKVAHFIAKSAKPKDKIFVWGNDPEIYALTRLMPPTRFVVAYHIKDFDGYSEVIKNLNQELPKFIVVTQNTSEFVQLESLINNNYLLVKSEGGAFVFSKTTAGVQKEISRI